jgi:hypothetical protein
MQLAKFQTWIPDLVCLIGATIVSARKGVGAELSNLVAAMLVFCLICTVGEFLVQRAQHSKMQAAFASIVLRGGLASMRWILALICVLLTLVAIKQA